MTRKTGYTIAQLADAASTTPRTVRFYTAEGLVPPPDARGRFALYSDEHLDRLRLISRLKEAHLPLQAIQERLVNLSHSEVREILAGAAKLSKVQSLDEILSHSAEIVQPRLVLAPHREMNAAEVTEGEQWQRIVLAPGLELHARLPLKEETQTLIRRLIESVRS